MISKKLLSVFDEKCIELGLEDEKPVLLSGKMAIDFIENHYLKRNKKISLKKVNGVFLYENLDTEYIRDKGIDERCLENGVICMVKEKKASLVHEVRHAYQLKNNPEYMFLEENEELKAKYESIYVYYSSEKDAFNYTIDYLKSEQNKIYSYHLNDGEMIDYIVNYWKAKQAKLKYLSYKANYLLLKIEYYLRYKRWMRKETHIFAKPVKEK